MAAVMTWRTGDVAFALDQRGRRVGIVKILDLRPIRTVALVGTSNYVRVCFVTGVRIWCRDFSNLISPEGTCEDWPVVQLARPVL